MNLSNVFWDNSSATANGTATENYLGWGFTAYSTLIIFLLVLVLNSLTLVLFAQNSYMRTPFAVYLMCLVISNIFYAVLEYPLFIVSSLYSTWTLNSGWCTVFLYATYVASAGAMHSQVLITVNRIWALIWPHSYSNLHSKAAAILVCALMWMYVHGLLLPGVVLDDLYYRVSLTENNCYLNSDAQPKWTMAIQFLVYVIPEMFILGSYPLLCYKQFRWRTRFRRQVGSTRPNSTRQSQEPGPSASKNVRPGAGNSVQESQPGRGREVISVRRSERRSHPFMVLTLLTLGMIVCWTPANTFYTVWSFVELADYTKTLQVVVTLYALQGVLDPVFFIVALKDLRESLAKLW